MEAQEYCPSAKLVLVGCKLDMRTDVSTLRELSKQRLIPVTHEQVSVNTLTHSQELEHEEKREIVSGHRCLLTQLLLHKQRRTIRKCKKYISLTYFM